MSPETERAAAEIVSPLPERDKLQWMDLSFRTTEAAGRMQPRQMHAELEAAARSAGQSPVAPAYRLWIAENMCREGQDQESLQAFDEVLETAARVERLIDDPDYAVEALTKKAAAAARLHNVDLAMQTYRDVAERTGQHDMLFEAGLVAERARRLTDAADLYQSAITAPPTLSAESYSELARRALARLNNRRALFAPHPETLSQQLVNALHSRDGELLRRLMSQTHFSVGVVGSEFRFENDDMIEHLLSDLGRSQIVCYSALQGSGMKRYLLTGGWQGEWFRGTVVFMFCESPRGWELSGVVLYDPGDIWLHHWTPTALSSRYTPPSPPPEPTLPFGLKAPWPAGLNMRAGGTYEFAANSAWLVALGPLAWLFTFTLADNDCGFGPNGFFYGQGATHSGIDHYAIDFTRYERKAPFKNGAGGLPVLSVAFGKVLGVRNDTPSGDSSKKANEVLVGYGAFLHPTQGLIHEWRARYLHMRGPNQIPVSAGMAVRLGDPLGFINDTGNSTVDHLHLSIHDQKNLFTPTVNGLDGKPLGHSVPVNPLEGIRPTDAMCIRSTNVTFDFAVPAHLGATLPLPHGSEASFGLGLDLL
jgi:tetratricopeptide (TPR) repeat protein